METFFADNSGGVDGCKSETVAVDLNCCRTGGGVAMQATFTPQRFSVFETACCFERDRTRTAQYNPWAVVRSRSEGHWELVLEEEKTSFLFCLLLES